MVMSAQACHVREREVLLLASRDTAGLPAQSLRLCGWSLVQAVNPATAGRLILDRPFHAGVALIERTGHDDLARLEELLVADADMQWVAAEPPTLLESAPLCRLLSELTFDYLTLPVDSERLLMSVGHAYGKGHLARRAHCPPDNRDQHHMVGASGPMRALYQSLDKVARDDAPVLITGESGTRKELAARAVHRLSKRCDSPFAAVNCGAFPGPLVQTELFGHEKGAFTGAHARKLGRFEYAQGGVVFLDEIGDLASDLQVNLLRFLGRC